MIILPYVKFMYAVYLSILINALKNVCGGCSSTIQRDFIQRERHE